MRISTAQSYESGIENLQRRQHDLSQMQEQMTTGKRVSKASDDPAAAARAERALASEMKTEASQRALDASRNAMTLTESALGDAGELLQKARETMVAAGNASYTDVERKSLALEMRALRDQLLSVANRSDGSNGYLFSGQGSSQPPFLDAPGGVAWRGTSGALQSASGETLPLTTDGPSTWLNAPSGNGVFETQAVPGSANAWIDAGRVSNPGSITGDPYTLTFGPGGTTYTVLRNGNPTALTNAAYTSGQAIEIDGMSFTVTGTPAAGDGYQIAPSSPTQSVFSAMDRAIADLETPLRTGAQITQGVNRSLRDIDAVSNRLQLVRAGAGETLARADGIESRLADARLSAQTTRANAEDMDMVSAISDFQNKQTGYDAALKTYSMMQRLSLFDYLKT